MKAFLRHHRDRAVAYLLTIRRERERNYLMALLRRIALLEAGVAALTAANLVVRVGELETEVTELNHPDTGAASASDVKALSGRVDDAETLLGTPDERAAALADAKSEAAAAAAAAEAASAEPQPTAAPADAAQDPAPTA